MPNISKAKYDELMATKAAWETTNQLNGKLNEERAVLQAQIGNFNIILSKIERIARGHSMMEMTTNQWSAGTITGSASAWSAPLQPGERPSGEELRRQELADLHYQVTRLESQMSAVAAIAEFAKQHKA